MKRPITPAYTFTPGSSSLNLSGIGGFSIGNLFAVIDLKTGALIYAPLAGYGYSALSGTTLTLQASMTGLSASDPLLILYDDGGKPAEDASVQAVTTALGTLNTDLTTLHTDVGTTLHNDLQSILTDLNNGLTNDTTALTAITATATWQASVLTALGTLNTDVSANHSDLSTLHTDVGTTLHADLAAILSKLGTKLSVSIDGDSITLTLPSGLALDTSVQSVVSGLATLNTALGANHADLATLHADVGTTLHTDLAAILAKQPATPALDGADVVGVTMPGTGGGGIRGWLSALYKAISGGAPNPPSLRTTGTLSALNDAVTLQVDGMNTAVIQLATGSWAGGPAVFEASADNGATWTAVNMLLYAGSAPAGSTVTGGLWEMACGGITHLRVRASAAITGGPVAAVVAATNGLKSVRVGNPSANPLTTTPGKSAASGDAVVTAGGTAQTLFAGATPANGWKIANPDPAEDLWVSDSATAAPNGQGSYRLPAGGIITTEPLERPCGPVSVYGATTGHVITARSW